MEGRVEGGLGDGGVPRAAKRSFPADDHPPVCGGACPDGPHCGSRVSWFSSPLGTVVQLDKTLFQQLL